MSRFAMLIGHAVEELSTPLDFSRIKKKIDEW